MKFVRWEEQNGKFFLFYKNPASGDEYVYNVPVSVITKVRVSEVPAEIPKETAKIPETKTEKQETPSQEEKKTETKKDVTTSKTLVKKVPFNTFAATFRALDLKDPTKTIKIDSTETGENYERTISNGFGLLVAARQRKANFSSSSATIPFDAKVTTTGYGGGVFFKKHVEKVGELKLSVMGIKEKVEAEGFGKAQENNSSAVEGQLTLGNVLYYYHRKGSDVGSLALPVGKLTVTFNGTKVKLNEAQDATLGVTKFEPEFKSLGGMVIYPVTKTVFVGATYAASTLSVGMDDSRVTQYGGIVGVNQKAFTLSLVGGAGKDKMKSHLVPLEKRTFSFGGVILEIKDGKAKLKLQHAPVNAHQSVTSISGEVNF